MDASGDDADPDPGGVAPSAAFFGIWPKLGAGEDSAPAGRKVAAAPAWRTSPRVDAPAARVRIA